MKFLLMRGKHLRQKEKKFCSKSKYAGRMEVEHANSNFKKGDFQNSNNYREIKMMSQVMKRWKKVIKVRMSSRVVFSQEQCRFMQSRAFWMQFFL